MTAPISMGAPLDSRLAALRNNYAARIKLTRRDVRDENMPAVIVAMHSRMQRDQARWPRVVHMVERAEFDPGAKLGEHAEFDTTIAERDSPRIATAWSDWPIDLGLLPQNSDRSVRIGKHTSNCMHRSELL
jgi:hypothetical protein